MTAEQITVIGEFIVLLGFYIAVAAVLGFSAGFLLATLHRARLLPQWMLNELDDEWGPR